jgi:ADP-ribose pyrophosphatase
LKKGEKTARVVTADALRRRTPGEKPKDQLGSTEIYRGKIIALDRDTVRFPDGSVSEFDIVRHPGAAAIVPFLNDPQGDDPQLLLLRQYRYAAGGYIFEIPAGRLDGDESPAACAARELKEETGCTAEKLELLYTMATTPGFTDEVIHVFMATSLTHGEAQRESDEFVDIVIFRLSEALELIRTGEIIDAKTALSLMYVAGFKSG